MRVPRPRRLRAHANPGLSPTCLSAVRSRYDRAFLLQFASLCVDMPDGLPAALDALRLAPRT